MHTGIGRTGHDNWEVENLSNGSMSYDLISVECWVEVPSDLVKANLQVNDQKKLSTSILSTYPNLLDLESPTASSLSNLSKAYSDDIGSQ